MSKTKYSFSDESQIEVLEYYAMFSYVDNFLKISKEKFSLDIDFAEVGDNNLHADVKLIAYPSLLNEQTYQFDMNYMKQGSKRYECTQPHIDKKNSEQIINFFIKCFPYYNKFLQEHDFVYKYKSELSNLIVKVCSIKWKDGKNNLKHNEIIIANQTKFLA